MLTVHRSLVVAAVVATLSLPVIASARTSSVRLAGSSSTVTTTPVSHKHTAKKHTKLHAKKHVAKKHATKHTTKHTASKLSTKKSSHTASALLR